MLRFPLDSVLSQANKQKCFFSNNKPASWGLRLTSTNKFLSSESGSKQHGFFPPVLCNFFLCEVVLMWWSEKCQVILLWWSQVWGVMWSCCERGKQHAAVRGANNKQSRSCRSSIGTDNKHFGILYTILDGLSAFWVRYHFRACRLWKQGKNHVSFACGAAPKYHFQPNSATKGSKD